MKAVEVVMWKVYWNQVESSVMLHPVEEVEVLHAQRGLPVHDADELTPGGQDDRDVAGSDEGKEGSVLDLRKQLKEAEEQRDRQTGLVEQLSGENEELRSRIQQLELAGAAGAGKEGVTL
jgi:hypothetical protein